MLKNAGFFQIWKCMCGASREEMSEKSKAESKFTRDLLDCS